MGIAWKTAGIPVKSLLQSKICEIWAEFERFGVLRRKLAVFVAVNFALQRMLWRIAQPDSGTPTALETTREKAVDLPIHRLGGMLNMLSAGYGLGALDRIKKSAGFRRGLNLAGQDLLAGRVLTVEGFGCVFVGADH